MKTRVVIFADEGKILTNGEVFGRQIFLAEGELISDYHEITEERYEEVMAKQTEEGADVY